MTTSPVFERESLPQRRVVVTGVGALTPLGLTLEETWKNALAGQSGIAKITRFNAEKFDVRIAGEVKGFSPDPYVPNKKEQKKLELFSHYAVAATSMALKNAQLTITDELSSQVGALVGVGMGGLAFIEEQVEQYLTKGPGRISPFFVPITITNMASGHISMLFNINGPNYAVTSACASGAHAIGEATEYIRRGQCKVMVAGGSESTVCAMAVGGFAAMKALSKRNDDPTHASRPFDENRDGFVLAEGAAILILEDYEFALKRNAPIICEITGYGASSDAHHITNPSPVGKGAALAMTGALKNAKLSPKDIQYINAHGTSTPVGDEIETLAVRNIFGDFAKKVWISSTKSMMGHTLGAAGAIESAICAMAIRDQIAPPTINLEKPSVNCDLDYIPNQARDGKIINVMNNSFGFGGTNATLIFSKIQN
jgi:3-oxoacyl-[acyl-carrier-protein] synthase II